MHVPHSTLTGLFCFCRYIFLVGVLMSYFIITSFDACASAATGLFWFRRYIFLVGMLMSQFTITGFDACAHMSEETRGADKSAPIAIVMAIAASAVAGFAYLLAIIFSIQSRAHFHTL